ncbi:MAG TPA: helix-turn-helix domain-containing protein [Bryobacteraceae bacterium]|nr:helix-turn-helix domain-containing protein [Bryobacteraceae bacterium]
MPSQRPRLHLPALGLELHRERAGVTLEEIADTTKISRTFLRAIEEGNYAALPGGVFTTSYIRQYAEAVGYDAAEILDHCRRSLAPEPEAEPENPNTGLPKWASRLLSLG